MLEPSTSKPAASVTSNDSAQAALGPLNEAAPRLSPQALREALTETNTSERQLLQQDARFRKYQAQIERSLQGFDAVVEWADFIACLSKLLRTIQGNKEYSIIPHKMTVAKRLSQCLNPALPSGLHQRALDVYAHIFGILGPDGLARDLAPWSSGLFPFFEFAAMSVRPAILHLFETYYVALDAAVLRPLAKAIAIALLPGLEEETGEFFDRVGRLLDRISHKVGQPFFLQNISLVLATAPRSRTAALNYIARLLPLDRSIITPSVGACDLLIHGIASSLTDSVILVQRSTLDMAAALLRLDEPMLRDVPDESRIVLVHAAIAVVLKRELSLSRRLYNWLLGGSNLEDSAAQIAYYKQHALGLVYAALSREMHAVAADFLNLENSQRQRPFRIFLSLLDRWEVGAPLTDLLIIPVFRVVHDILSRHGPAANSTTNASENPLQVSGDPLHVSGDPLHVAGDPARTRSLTLASDSASRLDSFPPSPVTPKKSLVKLSTPTGQVSVAASIETLAAKLKQPSSTDDLLLTVRSLADAVDPTLFWRRLFLTTQTALDNADAHDLDVVLLALRKFPVISEEPQHQSYALLYTHALIDLILQHAASQTPPPVLLNALDIVSEIMSQYTSVSSDHLANFARWIPPHDDSPLALARSIFNSWDPAAGTPRAFPIDSLAPTSDALTSRLIYILDAILTHRNSALVAVTERIISLLKPAPTDPVPSAWSTLANHTLPHLLDDLPASHDLFSIHYHAVRAAIAANSSPDATNLIDIYALYDKLTAFLLVPHADIPSNAAALLWHVDAHWGANSLESYLANLLAQPSTAPHAIDTFAALWKYTSDSWSKGFLLRVPAYTVLDYLRPTEQSLVLRRKAEAFMRCALKSFPRLLDPLLTDLLHQLCSSSFDAALVIHLLDLLLHVARHGGHGFVRVVQATPLRPWQPRDPLDPYSVRGAELISRLANLAKSLPQYSSSLDHHPEKNISPDKDPLLPNGEAPSPAPSTPNPQPLPLASLKDTYLDIIIRLATQLIVSGTSHDMIHLISLDIIQTVTARATSGPAFSSSSPHDIVTLLGRTYRALVDRLAVCVASRSLDLQNKFLHVIHSLAAQGAAPSDPPSDAQLLKLVASAVHSTNPEQSNGAMLHHWVDFVLISVPTTRPSIIIPLVDLFIYRVVYLVAAHPHSADPDDLSALLNAIERLLVVALDDTQPSRLPSSQEPSKAPSVTSEDKSKAPPASSLNASTSYSAPPNVLAQSVPASDQDAHSSTPEGQNHEFSYLDYTKPIFYKGLIPSNNTPSATPVSDRLRSTIHLLLFTWESLNNDKTRLRSIKILEKVYQLSPAHTLECIVEFWDARNAAAAAQFRLLLASNIARVSSSVKLEATSAPLTVLDQLVPGPKTVITMFCDKYTPKMPSRPFFPFWESYVARFDGPASIQVWSQSLMFAWDVLGMSLGSKPPLYPTLRVLVTLGENLANAGALQDRRIRRDLQDTFTRLVDATVQATARNIDNNGWADNVESREVVLFLAYRVVPSLRLFSVDPDKAVAVCSNMVYHLLTPVFKGRSKKLAIEQSLLILLSEMARFTVLLKAYRTFVMDVVNDNRFFNADPSVHSHWKPLVIAAMSGDTASERMADLISRVSTIPSTNIFTNRATEAQSRSLALRRLSYTLLTSISPSNQALLHHLPSIQEKLVDLLRAGQIQGHIVHAEVYLCLRVLLFKVGHQHLSGIWPVILTELLRLFDSLIEEFPSDDNPAFLTLIASATKFVDLTLVLQSQEFAVHQWMFVTDTPEAVAPPHGFIPQALLDRLGLLAAHSPLAGLLPSQAVPPAPSMHVRRPFPGLKDPSAADLGRVFQSISRYAFLRGQAETVDIAAVEDSIVSDMFVPV